MIMIISRLLLLLSFHLHGVEGEGRARKAEYLEVYDLGFAGLGLFLGLGFERVSDLHGIEGEGGARPVAVEHGEAVAPGLPRKVQHLVRLVRQLQHLHPACLKFQFLFNSIRVFILKYIVLTCSAAPAPVSKKWNHLSTKTYLRERKLQTSKNLYIQWSTTLKFTPILGQSTQRLRQISTSRLQLHLQHMSPTFRPFSTSLKNTYSLIISRC